MSQMLGLIGHWGRHRSNLKTARERELFGFQSGPDFRDADIRIVVLEVGHGLVKLGTDASPNVPVHRLEVWERIEAGQQIGVTTQKGNPNMVTGILGSTRTPAFQR